MTLVLVDLRSRSMANPLTLIIPLKKIPNLKTTGNFPQSSTAKQAVFAKPPFQICLPYPCQFIDEFPTEILENFIVIDHLSDLQNI